MNASLPKVVTGVTNEEIRIDNRVRSTSDRTYRCGYVLAIVSLARVPVSLIL